MQPKTRALGRCGDLQRWLNVAHSEHGLLTVVDQRHQEILFENSSDGQLSGLIVLTYCYTSTRITPATDQRIRRANNVLVEEAS